MSLELQDQIKEVAPPAPEAFKGKQLDLFRSLLCNNDRERAELSNTLMLWDSVPRYAVSRQQMDKIRKEKGFLPLLCLSFRFQERDLKVNNKATQNRIAVFFVNNIRFSGCRTNRLVEYLFIMFY